MIAKFKEFVKAYHHELVLGVVIISVTVISFNLGRLSVGNQTAKLPFTISTPCTQAVGPLDSGLSGQTAKNPQVVASKAAGSKLYHFTWCSGAKLIPDK